MKNKKLHIDQLENKIKPYLSASKIGVPPTGWIKSIRITLGITQQQLAKKLNISKQSLQEIEQREKSGSITLNTLKQVACALDMKLVYGFVPEDGSINALINRKAQNLALKIVNRTSANMKLEAQSNSVRRIKRAVKERATNLKNEIPKILWD